MRFELKGLVLAASAALVAALATPAPSSATEPDVLVVGKAGDADNLDPAVTPERAPASEDG